MKRSMRSSRRFASPSLPRSKSLECPNCTASATMRSDSKLPRECSPLTDASDKAYVNVIASVKIETCDKTMIKFLNLYMKR